MLCTNAARAQSPFSLVPSFGVEGGVPLNGMFSTYSVTVLDYPVRYTPFSYSVPRYVVGPYAVFHFTRHWGFEVDALYRPGSIAFEQPLDQFYEHTHFDDWQFPFMFQYTFARGPLRPFFNAGASFRHISGVQTTFIGPPSTVIPPENNSDFLRNWSSWGGVVGAGITLKLGPLELKPQVRYTRWVNQDFNSLGLTNSLNESVILLGIGF